MSQPGSVAGSSLRSKRGLSLAEAIVATTLALFLGLLMLKLLTSGLGAHSKGTESRDAQSGVRSLVGLLVAELRSSTPPPLSDPLVITPVFWPGVWGADQESASSDPFYPRETTAIPDSTSEWDSATNRVLYVRAKDVAPDESEGPLAPYALVELYVPKERPWLVERRIHSLTGLDALLLKGDVKGADEAQRKGWLLDISTLESLDPPEQPDVLFDAGPNARVAFRVSHQTFQPTSDPGRTRFPQLFEPGVFRLEVSVAIRALEENAGQKAWPEKKDWGTMREETTEIRIPAVQQS